MYLSLLISNYKLHSTSELFIGHPERVAYWPLSNSKYSWLANFFIFLMLELRRKSLHCLPQHTLHFNLAPLTTYKLWLYFLSICYVSHPRYDAWSEHVRYCALCQPNIWIELICLSLTFNLELLISELSMYNPNDALCKIPNYMYMPMWFE